MSGQRFHTNPETGEPGECRAKVKCQFGTPMDEHHDSPEAARGAYEQSQADQEVASVKKTDPVLTMPFRLPKSNPLRGERFKPWRGETVGEVLANIREDYEKVKDVEIVDPKTIFSRLADPLVSTEPFDITFEHDTENPGEFVLEVVDNHGSHDEPLRSKHLIEEELFSDYDDERHHYVSDELDRDEFGDYDDPWADEPNFNRWVYRIPGLSDQVKANELKKVLEPSYNTMNNPSLPSWAALPPRGIYNQGSRGRNINPDDTEALKELRTKNFLIKLASHHPAKDENDRKAAAKAWVDAHPEVLDQEWIDR